jgi:acid phosphatase (class A)
MTRDRRCHRPPARAAAYAAAGLALVVGGCAAIDTPPTRPTPPEMSGSTAQGYLAAAALPDSLALLPPPPAAGTPREAADIAANAAALPLRGSPRWTLAAADNVLDFPFAAGTFSCALDVPISREATPRLYALLRRSLADAGRATGAAKDHYRRPRPFVVNDAPICARDTDRARLVQSGSYPSGHATVGWAWALILTEIAPDRSAAVLARGRTYGQSRVVCNVHWQSDVDAGEVIGAATVALLHADAGFRTDVEAAKSELAALRARGEKARDCTVETAAAAAKH